MRKIKGFSLRGFSSIGFSSKDVKNIYRKKIILTSNGMGGFFTKEI